MMRCVCALVVGLLVFSVSAPALDLDHLMVNDVGTKLDTPEVVSGSLVAVSPDGKWVAYVETMDQDDTYNALYVMSTISGQTRMLFYSSQYDEVFSGIPLRHGDPITGLSFTPDNREVTFTVAQYDSTRGSIVEIEEDENGREIGMRLENPQYCLKSVNVLTGEVLDIGYGRSPRWDPTGRRLLYINDDWRARVAGFEPQYPDAAAMLFDRQTGEIAMLGTFEADKAVFAPGGEIVYYFAASEELLTRPGGGGAVNTEQLFWLDVESGEAEQVSRFIDDVYVGGSDPVISPDGAWVYFTETTNVSFTVNLDVADDDPSTTGQYSAKATALAAMSTKTGECREIYPATDNLTIVPSLVTADRVDAWVHDNYLAHSLNNGRRVRSSWLVTCSFDPGEMEPATAVEAAPRAFPTLASFPNPFNPRATLAFTLPAAGHAELVLYNMAGQKVRTLVAGHLAAGSHRAVWDGRDEVGRILSSGVFVARLEAGGTTLTSRMVLVR